MVIVSRAGHLLYVWALGPVESEVSGRMLGRTCELTPEEPLTAGSAHERFLRPPSLIGTVP